MSLECNPEIPVALGEAGIKIAGRNINNLRYADDSTLMAESEEELKSLLMMRLEALVTSHDSRVMTSSPSPEEA